MTAEDRFAVAIGEVALVFQEYGRIIMDQVLPMVEETYNRIYAAYVDQGAIYGESHEGLLRWVRELAEIREHLLEAERIRSHHEMLASLREKVS